jgi:nitrous oxidase accessory protein NosD
VRLILSTILWLAVSSTAFGQYLNTYVSTSGSDNKSCVSPEMACATIRGALKKTLPGGVVRVISAIYPEGMNIDKSVTIDGGNVASLTGVYLNGLGTNVTIRNINFDLNSEPRSVPIGGSVISTIGSRAKLTLQNVNINNATLGDNFGFSVSNAEVNLVNVTVRGGGLSLITRSAGGLCTVNITRADFSGTPLSDTLRINGCDVVIRDSMFRSSATALSLIAVDGPTTAYIRNTDFSGNVVGLEVGQTIFTNTACIDASSFLNNGTGIKWTGSPTVLSLRTNVFAGNATDGAPEQSTSFR